MPNKVFIVMSYIVDDSDEILEVCLTEKRAMELADAYRETSDYEIGVVTMGVTE